MKYHRSRNQRVGGSKERTGEFVPKVRFAPEPESLVLNISRFRSINFNRRQGIPLCIIDSNYKPRLLQCRCSNIFRVLIPTGNLYNFVDLYRGRHRSRQILHILPRDGANTAGDLCRVRSKSCHDRETSDSFRELFAHGTTLSLRARFSRKIISKFVYRLVDLLTSGDIICYEKSVPLGTRPHFVCAYI